MIKKTLFWAFIICTQNTKADFNGFFEARIKDESGNDYGLTLFNDDLNSNQEFMLDQLSGQSLVILNPNKILDGSKNKKYYAKLKIELTGQETYEANIDIYKINQTYQSVNVINESSKKEVSFNFIGELNKNIEYRVENLGDPDLLIRVKIDKKFSIDEIKNRFLKKGNR